jgi:5'(3')-deoxyribonucleotidase
MKKQLLIGLDLDDVLFDFFGEYLKIFGKPKTDSEITKNVFKLRNNKVFWENLPKIRNIDFIPALYCTKRISSKTWTKNCLAKNHFPNRPLYQRYYQLGKKSTLIKGRCDVFIDDSVSNFKEINSSGTLCLLMDAPHNQHFDTPLRIKELSLKEIKTKYNEFYSGNSRNN